MSSRFLESHWFVWVTQMNHIVMEIDLDHYRDWFSSQVRDPAKPGPHCLCLHPDLATSVDPGLCWASLVLLVACWQPLS